VAVYLALLVAYVGVLKYMSETAEKKSNGTSVSPAGEPQQYQHRREFA
jgi:cytochrome bd ubiquinol oxidase subunit I